MTILLAIICLIYAPVLLWLLMGALTLDRFHAGKIEPQTTFSILVPFRNEADNLPILLRSIQTLDYPVEKMEVILINDGSTDASMDIIREFEQEISEISGLDLQVLQNKRKSESPKKDAITLGVEKARYDWIVCTDADCQLPPQWLRLYDQCIQHKKPEMICGPIAYPEGNSILETYQLLDGLSLQLVTMAGFGWKRPMLCNGANMGYARQVFDEVSGYEGNDHIASGDDIFLLAKLRKKYPSKIAYLKTPKALVQTRAEGSWKDVITQRIRWATKTSNQSISETKFIGLAVFLGNMAFVVALVLFFISSTQLLFFMIIIGVKTGLDLLLLLGAGGALKRRISITGYFLNIVVYPLITIWVVIRSLGGSYEWKRRTFKK